MKYSDSIEALKAGLLQYSEDEKKLSELYQQAVTNAEAAYKAAKKEINDQYLRDRNEAHVDTVREERNLNNSLAHRGLGFSGEAAQTKLNSNIILANRLGEITRGKVNAETELLLDLSDKKNDLALDNAEKLREIQKSKDGINASIASIIAEREDNANKIKAEKELQAAKLQAEKDMLELELNAKYGNVSSGGDAYKDTDTDTDDTDNDTQADSTYLPKVSAKELARLLVSSASGGGSLLDGSKKQQYAINKYILELTDKYGVSDEYVKDLIFVLRSYGYVDSGESSRRISVISYGSRAYYDDVYDKYYDEYVKRGISEGRAGTEARAKAIDAQLEYIYNNSSSVYEFKSCCTEAGISVTDMMSFLSNAESKKMPYSVSIPNHATDTLG